MALSSQPSIVPRYCKQTFLARPKMLQLTHAIALPIVVVGEI